jgi:hypothetical protein
MSVTTKSIIAIGAAAFLALAGAMSTADAGRGGGKGGGIHMGGSAKFHTNQGGKYAYRGGGGGAKFQTNQGLKYGYRGSGGKFHTNQGGKYRGWSGKFDNHHHGKYGHRRYGYPWYGLPLYTYGGGCGWLYRQAVATGSDYWWDRYYQCTGSYY